MVVQHETAVVKLVLIAGCVSILCWFGMAADAATYEASADRTVAMVRPAHGYEPNFVDLSADRHVLYVTGAKDGQFGDRSGKIAQTTLSIYDVADPVSPHQLSVLPLGDISVWRVVAVGGRLLIQHGWDDPKRPFGVTIVDVRDASHPAVIGNVAVAGDLALSRDHTVAQISPPWPEKTKIAFTLDRPDRPIASDQVPPDLELLPRHSEPFRGPFGYQRDQAGERVLTTDGFALHVLTPEQDAAPKRVLSVTLKPSIVDARLLSDGAVAVVVGPDGVTIVSLKPPALDTERLKKLHAHLVAEYPGALKKRLASDHSDPGSYEVPIPPKLDTFYFGLAVALEEAGVRDLLDDAKAGGLPLAARVGILNDYGFWLSKSIDPLNAVEALQKVIELAPSRAIAALNLGDAARSAMTVAPTWQQKTTLARIGLQAYATYRKLGGQEAPAAREFALLHGSDAIGDDVCSYVATFYNQGRQSELWGNPDPVDIAGDGKLRHVYTFTQGTAHAPVIIAVTPSKLQTEADMMMLKSEVDFGDPGGWLAEPHAFPFKTGYFVVYDDDDGPSTVVKPDGPTVCQFKRSFTAVLIEDHAPPICREALAGTTFEKVPRQKRPDGSPRITSEQLGLVHTESEFVDIAEFSDVKFDPTRAPARLGYFEIASGAGRGCDVNGVAFLNGDTLEESPRETALINAQRQMMNCSGSTAFVVRTDGEFLIEIDGGQSIRRTIPPRLLLRSHGDRIETACRVEQRPSYAAEPPSKTR
jgi:hypothetical protein